MVKSATNKKATAVPAMEIGRETKSELYRLQLELRYCEKRAYDLFLQNLIKGTSHLSLGQEAIAAAFGVAMRPDDWTFCTYRGHAHTLAQDAGSRQLLNLVEQLQVVDVGQVYAQFGRARQL